MRTQCTAVKSGRAAPQPEPRNSGDPAQPSVNQPIKCKKQPYNQTSRRGHYRPRSLNIDPSPLDEMED